MNIKKFLLVSVVISILMTSLSATAGVAATARAENGKLCTIVGTKGSDVLRGTSKSDVICGLGGKDTIIGGGGVDTLDGGSGADTLKGGPGSDYLYGGSENDTLEGESGKDYYFGGQGLNSCDITENSNEIRDYTCSLLPKLSYLFSRFSGQIISENLNFDGCVVWIARVEGGEVVSEAEGLIYGGGHFNFDAPEGVFQFAVQPPQGTNIHNCKVENNIRITAPSVVLPPDNPLEVQVPTVRTKIYVQTSRGAILPGAGVSAIGSSHGCKIAANQPGMCADIWSPSLTNMRTNSLGFLEVVMPAGTQLTIRASVKVAGILMSSESLTTELTQATTHILTIGR